MTSNIKRLGALAVAQCGAFVIVLIFGAFGGPGHPGPARPAPGPTATHSIVSPSASATPARTGGQPTGPGTRSSATPHPSTGHGSAAAPGSGTRSPNPAESHK
jgi:hypothetical protein